MVITTRSKSKFTMSIAAEVRDYFESLIKPLVTNESLEKLLGAFQEKIVKRFEEKLDEQNAKIIELQSKIAIQDNALQRLEIKCDDNEQYSRRSCIRIHGVQYNENDDISVINKVEQCCDEIGVKFDMNEIDRVHYIGKPVFDTVSKQKVRSMIVKFKSWESRTAFYKARPRNVLNGKKKPGAKSFSVSLDLTKRRYALLSKAKGLVKDNPSVAYAFCDINCSLAIKFNDNTYKYFNIENELRKLLVL